MLVATKATQEGHKSRSADDTRRYVYLCVSVLARKHFHELMIDEAIASCHGSEIALMLLLSVRTAGEGDCHHIANDY